MSGRDPHTNNIPKANRKVIGVAMTSRRLYLLNRNNRIVSLYKVGRTCKEIAAVEKVNICVVYRMVRKAIREARLKGEKQC